MMSITMIVIIWLLAPLIELGIIVGLVIERDKVRRQLQVQNSGKPEGTLKRLEEKAKNPYTAGYAHASGYGVWPEQRSEQRQEQRPEQRQEQRPEQRSEQKPEQNQEIQSANAISKYQPEKTMVKCRQEKQEKSEPKRIPFHGNMGTAALILGIIFIVLAGAIFATTTWKIMEDSYKILFIFSGALLFFSASAMARKWFHIRKTSNAFYLLGSIFLFLSVIAAAYFQVFGPEFILEGSNRWKVLWVGSLVLEGAFLAGVKWFYERMYAQSSLWCMSVAMLFMALAFQVEWKDFCSLMTIYSAGLVVIEGLAKRKKETGFLSAEKSAFCTRLSREMPVFAHVHFWLFGSITMVFGISDMALFQTTSVFGAAALLALVFGMRFLKKTRQKDLYGVMYALSAAELCFYASLILESYVFCFEGILLFLLCVLTAWDIWKREDLGVPVLVIGAMMPFYFYLEDGTDVWWFSYTIFLAVYLFRYRRENAWRKPALSASAFLFAVAFWGQSFIEWPEWIELECYLLPIVLLLWAMGEIWGQSREMRWFQSIGYMLCLGRLAWDACVTELLADALITQVCCLLFFIRGQMKKDVWWVRISGGLMLVLALFMTKEFWLSISWWIYLLAAGIGLILFAAVSEKKKD